MAIQFKKRKHSKFKASAFIGPDATTMAAFEMSDLTVDNEYFQIAFCRTMERFKRYFVLIYTYLPISRDELFIFWQFDYS